MINLNLIIFMQFLSCFEFFHDYDSFFHQAIDDDANQTAQLLASLLDWPQVILLQDLNLGRFNLMRCCIYFFSFVLSFPYIFLFYFPFQNLKERGRGRVVKYETIYAR